MAEFCQLQRLLEWILKSLSWSSKLFITLFLTTFTSTKTLYGVIGNNCIRFEESKIIQLFSLFLNQLHNFFSHERILNVILCILGYRCCEFRSSTFFSTLRSFLWLILLAYNLLPAITVNIFAIIHLVLFFFVFFGYSGLEKGGLQNRGILNEGIGG